MKKIRMTLLLAALTAFAANAEQISESQALAVASRYMAFSSARQLAPAKAKANQQAEAAPYYVFNTEDGNGFVIVSGDDDLTEIIGYSTSGKFDPDNVPTGMQAWLDDYAGYVERVQSGASVPFKQSVILKAAVVEPLVTTRWNQSEPFNALCPIVGTERSVVGCVATAMAQVMNYWEWPVTGKGNLSYLLDNETIVSADFSKSTYDWANMADSYNGSYTTEQANAVAQLSYDCGVAVRMSYSPEASGALDGNVPYALAQYFGYKTQLYRRDAYTSSAFLSIIKNELDNKRPMLFAGNGSAGGHEFVVDGYDSNNFLHINWGWGGISDGYFDMNLMNPSSLGIGGGGGGFVNSQTICTMEKDETMAGNYGQQPLAIYSYNGYCQTVQSALKKGDLLEVAIRGFYNMTYYEYTGTVAAAIYDIDCNRVALSSNTNPVSIPGLNVVTNETTYTFRDQLNSLTDGTYLIYPVSKETKSGETFDWMPVATDGITVLTVKGDDITVGLNEEEASLSLAKQIEKDKDVINPGDKVTFTVTLKNDAMVALSGSLNYEIRDHETGSRKLSGSKNSIHIPEKGESSASFSVTLQKAAFKNGSSYEFVITGFKSGSTTYEIASEFDPLVFTIGQSGVSAIGGPAEISVYPNPTAGEVTVNADSAIESIEVYSLDGRLVKKSEDTRSMDLSDCPDGVYLLRAATADSVATRRVIVRK